MLISFYGSICQDIFLSKKIKMQVIEQHKWANPFYVGGKKRVTGKYTLLHLCLIYLSTLKYDLHKYKDFLSLSLF